MHLDLTITTANQKELGTSAQSAPPSHDQDPRLPGATQAELHGEVITTRERLARGFIRASTAGARVATLETPQGPASSAADVHPAASDGIPYEQRLERMRELLTIRGERAWHQTLELHRLAVSSPHDERSRLAKDMLKGDLVTYLRSLPPAFKEAVHGVLLSGARELSALDEARVAFTIHRHLPDTAQSIIGRLTAPEEARLLRSEGTLKNLVDSLGAGEVGKLGRDRLRAIALREPDAAVAVRALADIGGVTRNDIAVLERTHGVLEQLGHPDMLKRLLDAGNPAREVRSAIMDIASRAQDPNVALRVLAGIPAVDTSHLVTQLRRISNLGVWFVEPVRDGRPSTFERVVTRLHEDNNQAGLAVLRDLAGCNVRDEKALAVVLQRLNALQPENHPATVKALEACLP